MGRWSNPTNPPFVIATSREEANQLFVDAYMADPSRVCRFE